MSYIYLSEEHTKLLMLIAAGFILLLAAIFIVRYILLEIELYRLRNDLNSSRARDIITKGSLLSSFQDLRKRFWSLNTEKKDAEEVVVRAAAKVIADELPYFGPDLTSDEVLQLVMNDAISRFGADTVALLAPKKDSNDVEVLYVSRRGNCGERFRHLLANCFYRVIFHQEYSQLGFKDHLVDQNEVSHFSLFDIQYSLSGLFTYEIDRILWLGFSRKESSPFEFQQDFVRYLSKLTRGLQEHYQMTVVRDRYAKEKTKSEQREKLLAYAAHDMRSPINNLRAILRNLQAESQNLDHEPLIAFRNCR
jgi:hypothetical protein